MYQSLEERFWIKVAIKEEDDCWEWLACTNRNGYGTIRVSGATKYAHRIAYELTIGTIPEELLVLHKCDNKTCVNPKHLFLGNYVDNMQDCARKGRTRKGMKLTETKVLEIREFLENGKIHKRRLAEIYGVTLRAINGIASRENWSHI